MRDDDGWPLFSIGGLVRVLVEGTGYVRIVDGEGMII